MDSVQPSPEKVLAGWRAGLVSLNESHRQESNLGQYCSMANLMFLEGKIKALGFCIRTMEKALAEPIHDNEKDGRRSDF
jgi:hypothetical protein